MMFGFEISWVLIGSFIDMFLRGIGIFTLIILAFIIGIFISDDKTYSINLFDVGDGD